jgi:mRNA interferase RelE/StbE
MYNVRIMDAASRELAQLDKKTARRLLERTHWLAEHLDEIHPEALAGELAGLFKLRVGDYRVVYEILRKDEIIVIHMIGHRREIYKRK